MKLAGDNMEANELKPGMRISLIKNVATPDRSNLNEVLEVLGADIPIISVFAHTGYRKGQVPFIINTDEYEIKVLSEALVESVIGGK